jgi:hypothetical protein
MTVVIPQLLFDDAFPAAIPAYDVPLTVDGTEYPLEVGADTAYGYFKNGFTVRTQPGKTYPHFGVRTHTYVLVTMLTSNHAKVQVEERWKFRKTDRALVSWTGFQGVDLLGIDDEESSLLEMTERLLKLAALRGEQ